jgi:hypothetical protein
MRRGFIERVVKTGDKGDKVIKGVLPYYLLPFQNGNLKGTIVNGLSDGLCLPI